MSDLDFSDENLPKLLEANTKRAKDSTPNIILGGVSVFILMLMFATFIAYTIDKQRTRLRQVISTCPTEVLSDEVCEHLDQGERVSTIPTPHNISPVCSINPVFEAQKNWKSTVCQLAADRPDLPNLSPACGAMQEYIRIVQYTSQEACVQH